MKVLIVGAGIAGDSLAVLLGRRGHQVTVVEIAEGMRSGGQTIDLRDDSRDVLEEWGLLDACLQRLVPQAGMVWVDTEGRPRARMPVSAFGGQGFVSAEELPRADLARVLHAAIPENVQHVFGDTVTELTALSEGVRASFAHRPAEVYDVVAGADGTHSRVRALAFGPESAFRRPLGLAQAWFTLIETTTTPPLEGWFHVHNAPGCRVAGARPGHPGRQEIGLSWPASDLPPRSDRAARLDHLRTAFTRVGWRAPELVAAASAAPDLAMDTIDQITVPEWYRGRVVLLGDSAWCPSPLSGLGTALALHGAAVLDHALHTHRDPVMAFNAYQQRMTPRVTAAQAMFPGRVASHAPRTRAGITAMTTTIRLAQTRPLAAALTWAATRNKRPDRAADPETIITDR